MRNSDIFCRKTFILIVEAKSTKGFESLPYICALLNTALWTYYGVEKTDGRLVAIVNGIGAFFEFVYVALFLRYTPMRV
jgi:solute carrier family 50 protein (sugar transporter)